MKYLYISACLMLLAYNLSAQRISGKIYDANTKEPVIGATIKLKYAAANTRSDVNGAFIIKGEPLQIIQVSAIGYEPAEINIQTNKVNIPLKASDNELEAIVVTASRDAQRRGDAPLSITKISAASINDAKPRDLLEMINKVSGVVMTNLGNEQHSMSIRQPMNSTNPYFLYLEDGIPIRTMGVFNHNGLIEINIPAVQSIEVVKGAASSIYGPEAIGGSINFIGIKPTALTTIKAGIQGDNFGYRRYHVAATGSINQKLGYAVDFNRTAQYHGWMLNSNYHKNAYTARFDYKLSANTLLWASYNQIDYYTQTSGSVDSIAFYNRSYTSTTDFTYRDVYAKRLRITGTHRWDNNNQTTFTAYWRKNEVGQNPTYTISWLPGSNTAKSEVNLSSFHSLGIVAQHSATFDLMNAKVLGGLSFDHSPNDYDANLLNLNAQFRPDGKSVEKYTVSNLNSEVYLTSYHAVNNNLGAWLQTEFTPFEHLSAVLGLRYDDLTFEYNRNPTLSQPLTASGTKSYQKLSPRVGLTYSVDKNKAVYINFSRGFVQANLSTLFNPANPQGLDLDPSQFTSFELGSWISLMNNKLFLDLSLYQMNGRNEIVNLRQADNSTIPMATGRTLHRGIEYAITYKATKEWNFKFSGTNALHRFEQFELSKKPDDVVKNADGNIMPSSPAWIANTEVIYKPTWFKGFRIGAEWQRISPWYQNQVNTVKYNDKGFLGGKGISLLNARTGYEWKNIDVFMNVYNVTNVLYANSTSRGNGGMDRTIYVPGAPRIYAVGIQYIFTAK